MIFAERNQHKDNRRDLEAPCITVRGVPAIATTISGASDAVGSAHSLLVPPGNLDALANTLHRLRDDALVRRLSNQAYHTHHDQRPPALLRPRGLPGEHLPVDSGQTLGTNRMKDTHIAAMPLQCSKPPALVVRHAMAWRLPGIVTSIRDAGNATGTTRGRVVLPGDTHALAAVLLVLQNDTLL